VHDDVGPELAGPSSTAPCSWAIAATVATSSTLPPGFPIISA
jgi:hypothetical protein